MAGLALYKLERDQPESPRVRRAPQSISEDVEALLQAQEVSEVIIGPCRAPSVASDSQGGLSFSTPPSSKGAATPRFVALPGEPRARLPLEAPRLREDVALLRMALAQPPLPGDDPRGGKRRSSCAGAQGVKPRARQKQHRTSVGGWYSPLPFTQVRLQEAARKARDLPEVKVQSSSSTRQARQEAPARQVSAKPSELPGLNLAGLTVQIPEVPQFEEPAPDRVSDLAKQLRIPLDILKQSYDVFAEICNTLDHPMATKGRRTNKKGEVVDDKFDVFQDGEVNAEGFARVICKLTGSQTTAELPDGLVQRSFRDADGNGTKSVSFLEFAFWYSRHGFMENMLLTSAQLQVRELARKYDLPVIEVEQYKKKFDLFDEDGSGMIDYREFTKLLSSLIKVPANLELPSSRVDQFWAEADRDRSNFISFEEFVLFFYRYFSLKGPQTCPFQEYYRGIRRVRVAYT